jgi:hypothetical protein
VLSIFRRIGPSEHQSKVEELAENNFAVNQVLSNSFRNGQRIEKQRRFQSGLPDVVCFQTKNPNLGKFLRALEWKML